MKIKYLLPIIGLTSALMSVSAVTFASNQSLEQESTIKYIFSDNGMERVSDEIFYDQFTSIEMYEENDSSPMLASTSSQEIEKNMLRFFLTEDGMFELTEDLYQEAIAENNFKTIAVRENLTPSSTEENLTFSSVSLQEFASSNSRLKGSWTINNTRVLSGYKTTFYTQNGGSFSVSNGEEIVFSFSPDRACYVSFGSTGTKNFSNSSYVDLKQWHGVTIATDTPGYYQFFVNNNLNNFDIIVNGSITVR